MKNNIDLKKRGLFIVLEGVDRIGKSTQVNKLKDYFLNNLKEQCETIAFPGNLIYLI